MKDKEKLKHLLEHWIEHNAEHAEEFRQWADKAKSLNNAAVHDEIQEAANLLQQANKALAKASEKLGNS